MSSKLAKKQFVMPKLPPDLVVRRQRTQTQVTIPKKGVKTKSASLLKKNDAVLLKKKIKNKKVVLKEILCTKLADQREYYPNKLKRNMTARKIVLKPKHNMKVVAGTNKRKKATPRKDYQIEHSEELVPSPVNPELSMCDAVRLADETCSLTDDDLMEILTCPSPVWWEDPPHAEYVEDALCRTPGEKTIKEKHSDSQSHTKTAPDSQPHTQTSPDSRIDFEQEISHFKIKTDNFIQKKKKLENVLDNIMNKNNRQGKRRLSESTEGEDIFSDLSLNEEEILQHLENLDIPIEGSRSDENDRADINPPNGTEDIILNKIASRQTITNDEDENMKEDSRKNKLKSSDNEQKSRVVVRKVNTSIKGCKNEQNSLNKKALVNNEINKEKQNMRADSIVNLNLINLDKSSHRNKQNREITGLIKVRSDLIKSEFDLKVPNKLPPLKRRPVPKSNIKMESSNINIDSISDANIRFISDEESIDEIFIDKNDLNEITGKNEFPKKFINDLTEYITVYKIMSNDEKKKLDNGATEIIKKNDNVIELNNFFKKCKSNKRLKKESTAAIDSDVKKGGNSDEMNVDEQNRLNGCDYCIEKNERGDTDFSCDTCNITPVFSCDLCSFRSNAKDVIINHVSRCNKFNRSIVMC